VVDPVMVAKGGAPLLEAAALDRLRARLLPMATVLTPNLPEAAALTGRSVTTEAEMRAALPALLALGARAVLLKGGHLEGAEVVDLLATAEGVEAFRAPRIASRHTHGTGCTLASAVATGLAQGMALREAVLRARAYVTAAIRSAPGFGHGHGPLDHTVSVGASTGG
jgi:hydroxymethylpyrimidine/phosphomethylpyrimidine kinase